MIQWTFSSRQSSPVYSSLSLYSFFGICTQCQMTVLMDHRTEYRRSRTGVGVPQPEAILDLGPVTSIPFSR
ncbi:Hypothetical protein R9X50_00167000 [Acrodontium crateriforme]|uniref:Uncharacterized protein n=1 Tax=Acrodontium crateriforme TaxID=150365 RepID=A0AAQ3LZE6_9PEZI|nr:Hypothetical protein R9X50_00167000 [Acrodontium crateriforme]